MVSNILNEDNRFTGINYDKVNIRSRNGDIELNSIKIANSILGESGTFDSTAELIKGEMVVLLM